MPLRTLGAAKGKAVPLAPTRNAASRLMHRPEQPLGYERYPVHQRTNLWNGNPATSGKSITVTNISQNGSLAEGANTSFGFQAR